MKKLRLHRRQRLISIQLLRNEIILTRTRITASNLIRRFVHCHVAPHMRPIPSTNAPLAESLVMIHNDKTLNTTFPNMFQSSTNQIVPLPEKQRKSYYRTMPHSVIFIDIEPPISIRAETLGAWAKIDGSASVDSFQRTHDDPRPCAVRPYDLPVDEGQHHHTTTTSRFPVSYQLSVWAWSGGMGIKDAVVHSRAD